MCINIYMNSWNFCFSQCTRKHRGKAAVRLSLDLLVFLIMVDLHQNITKITHVFAAVKRTSLLRSWYISSQTYVFPLSPGFPKSTE